MSAAAIALGPVADWLGTFALHSTVALALAWATSAVLGQRAPQFQERLLRFSLWVALASSTLQFAVLGSPLELSLPELPRWESGPSAAAIPLQFEMLRASLAPTPAATTAPWQLPSWSWSTLLVGAAVTMALFGCGWLVVGQRRLRRVLRQRQPEVDARVLATAAEVAREQGLQQSPQLSRSALLGTPIAFGWVRPEICLPVRASELGDASLRALLAHEVAHLRRRDPAWMWVAIGLQALFPWQLLTVAVRRRWARLVELRCDAIAAQHSSPTAVARCLLDVAEWLRPSPKMPVVALGMAARPSSLRERIEAALHPRPAAPARRMLSLLFGGLSLSSLTLAAPGVQTEVTTVLSLANSPLASASPFSPGAALPTPAAVESASQPDPIAAVPSVGGQATREAFALLQEEYATLVAEVEQLRAETRNRPRNPELEQLVSTLTRRLLVVDRSRTRLQALLDRRVPKPAR